MSSGSVQFTEYSANDSTLSYSTAVELADSTNAYLFQIKDDVSEKYNVLNPDCSCYNESAATVLVAFAYELLEKYIESQPLYTPPLDSLTTALESGDPISEGFLSEVSDELFFLGPFMTDEEYLEAINSVFEAANESGTEVSESLKSLYTASWKTPSAMPSSAAAMFTRVIVILIIAAALLAVCCTVIMYYCNKSRRQRYGPYTYTPIKDDEMEEATHEQRTEVYIYT